MPDLFREGQGIIAIGELTTAGGAGMPLAVKQIALPGFPLSLTLSDADTHAITEITLQLDQRVP